MQKKHMERCLFALIVLLIFALTILGLYRVTKHSAAPASTTIPAVSPAASPADDPTATSSPTPNPVPSPTPTPPDRVDSYAVQGIEVASHQSDTMHWRIERAAGQGKQSKKLQFHHGSFLDVFLLTANVLLCRAQHRPNRKHGALSRASARAKG